VRKTTTPSPTGSERKAALRAEQQRQRRRALLIRAGLVVLVAAAALYGVTRLTGSSQSGSSDGISYAVGKPGPGQAAPPVTLAATTGSTFNLASALKKGPVLLYFQEGLSCQPCWDQLTAIKADQAMFQALGVNQIVSITTDPLDQITQKVKDEGITAPVLSDETMAVSKSYDANAYGMMGGSRDGHTFILVGADGKILWRADYGGPPNYTMFVPDAQLISHLRSAIAKA
jgi:peroxiredoxin